MKENLDRNKSNFYNYFIIFIIINIFQQTKASEGSSSSSQPIPIPRLDRFAHLLPYDHPPSNSLVSFGRPFFSYMKMQPFESHSLPFISSFLKSAPSEQEQVEKKESRRQWRQDILQQLETNQRLLENEFNKPNLEINIFTVKRLAEERFSLDAQKKILDQENDQDFEKTKHELAALKEVKGRLRKKIDDLEALNGRDDLIRATYQSNENLQERIARLEHEKEDLMVLYDEIMKISQAQQNEYDELSSDLRVEKNHASNLSKQLQLKDNELDDAINDAIPDGVYTILGDLIDRESPTPAQRAKDALESASISIIIPGAKEPITTEFTPIQKKYIKGYLGFSKDDSPLN